MIRSIVLTLFLIMSVSVEVKATSAIPIVRHEVALLAGGCFWCMQKPYDQLNGIIDTSVGYTGGNTSDPSYIQVSAGGSGHYEALKIIYDPNFISFKEILDIFWRNIDPTDGTGQFCDKGDQYRSCIFYLNETQLKIAQESKMVHEKLLGKKIETKIIKASSFFKGEEYHQKYYEKNPLRYKYYRYS